MGKQNAEVKKDILWYLREHFTWQLSWKSFQLNGDSPRIWSTSLPRFSAIHPSLFYSSSFTPSFTSPTIPFFLSIQSTVDTRLTVKGIYHRNGSSLGKGLLSIWVTVTSSNAQYNACHISMCSINICKEKEKGTLGTSVKNL